MNHPLRFLAGALLALGLVACQPSAPAPQAKNASPPMRLKLYHVPAQQSAELVQALHKTLTGKSLGDLVKGSNINVTEPFPGTVMVLAPPDLQSSIGNAISELVKASAKAPTKASGYAPLKVHFWVVQAKAGQEPDDVALNALTPTLKQIRGSLGPSHFVLDEAASSMTTMTSLDRYNPTSRSKLLTSHKHLYEFSAISTRNGAIRLNISYDDHTGQTLPHLETTAMLHAGHYLVLAQGPSAAKSANPGDKDATLMNLLVVRVDRPGASQH